MKKKKGFYIFWKEEVEYRMYAEGKDEKEIEEQFNNNEINSMPKEVDSNMIEGSIEITEAD